MKSLLLLLLAVAPLSAQIGPDYVRPETTAPARYKHAPKWRETRPLDHLPRGEWWRVFDDAKLNELLVRATGSNQQLRAAVARFDQARATARIARGYFFPQVTSASSFTKQETSGNLEVPFPINGARYRGWNLEVPLDLTYEIDLWGKVRREFEGTRAEAAGAAAAIHTVLLSIQAELAQNYFRLRSIDAELATVRAAIELRREALGIVNARVKAGTGSELEQAQAQTELAIAETELSGLKNQRDQLETAIAVLVDTPPAAFRLGALKNPELLKAPPAIPAGVPSDLLERRPDVAEAERTLAAATARIGVARSLAYPSVRLLANAGFTSGDLGTLFQKASGHWSLGPSVTIPILSGGRNKANVERAYATADEALAGYRAALLAAFADVENALTAITHLREQAATQTRARESADKAAKLARVRYESGTSPYLDVIETHRTALAMQRIEHQLAGQRSLAAVSLIKALGGGWSQALPVEIPAPPADADAASVKAAAKPSVWKKIGSVFSRKRAEPAR